MFRLISILPLVTLSFLLLAPHLSGADVTEALKTLARFEQGHSRAPLVQISDAVREASSVESKRALERQLLAFLKSDATAAGRDAVTRQLSRIASDDAVPVLTSLLLETDTSDVARYALESIEGELAAKALRDALVKTSGDQKIGILNSLGQRKDAPSVKLISPLIHDKNPDIAATSVSVLGQIATEEAIQALTAATGNTSEGLRDMIFDALLQCADTLIEDDKHQAANRIFKSIFRTDASDFIRSAALRGMVLSAPDQSLALIRKAIRGRNAELRSVAISLAGQSESKGMTSLLVKELPRLPVEVQSQLLVTLGQRGDKVALPAVTKLAKSQDPDLRIKAIEQLAQLGDESTVPLLISVACNSKGNARLTARSSLYRLNGDKVNDAVSSHLLSDQPDVRIEAVKAIGQRKISAAANQLLLSSAHDPDQRVRRECLKVHSEFSTVADVPQLLTILVQATESGDREDAGKALVSLFRRNGNDGLDSVLTTLEKSNDLPTKAVILNVAGSTKSPMAEAVLQKALNDDSVELRKTAIRSLSEWKTSSPMPSLLHAAKTDSDKVSRILALRGYIKLAGIKEGRSNEATVQLLAAAMKVAERTDEKRSILALLPRFPSHSALKLAESAITNPDLAAEARSAVEGIKSAPQ